MSLTEAIDSARLSGHHADGKCSMCAAGDDPENGMHRGQYPCGNEQTCLCCHNAGMEYGDQCAACGRIEKRKPIMGCSGPNAPGEGRGIPRTLDPIVGSSSEGAG